jgi:hypothetical protein
MNPAGTIIDEHGSRTCPAIECKVLGADVDSTALALDGSVLQ